jgi:hypothetical protein
METQLQPQADNNSDITPSKHLDYQLEILKMEIEYIGGIFARIDEIGQTTKNWAIVVWAGVITLVLGAQDLRKYIFLTAILPLLFWFIEAWWKHLQRRSGYRMKKITEFLNDGRLEQSYAQGKLIDFKVLDPVGEQYKGIPEYQEYTSLKRMLRFFEIRWFYLGLTLISIILSVVFALVL